jgi:MFS family permease
VKAPASSVAEFLGLKRNIVILLAAIVLIGAGEETWMRFVPRYLEALGAAPFIIGLFDAIKTLLGAVYAYPGGVLADRWGHRRALVLFNALSIAGYALALMVPHWAAVLGGMFLFLAWSNLSLPATFSLVGSTLGPEKYTMGIGVQSLIKRIPIVIGPVAGGSLIDRYNIVGGVRIGLGLSVLLGAASIAIQKYIREETAPRASAGGLWSVIRGFDPPLRRLLLSDILVRFCERIPYAWVVIYAMDRVGVSGAQFGILTALEMLVAIACFIPVAHLADRHGKEPFVIATFAFFTLFPLMLLAADSFRLLLLAFVVRGLKEFGDPARKALIVASAAAQNRGRTIGAYYLVRDTLVSTGSFLGVALWSIGPHVNFVVAAIAGALGTLAYILTLRTSRAANRG